MNFAVFLGRALTATRHERGLKRRQLMERSGASGAYLCELENGQKLPSMLYLLRLADALNLPASALLARAEHLQSLERMEVHWPVPRAQVAPVDRPGWLGEGGPLCGQARWDD